MPVLNEIRCGEIRCGIQPFCGPCAHQCENIIVSLKVMDNLAEFPYQKALPLPFSPRLATIREPSLGNAARIQLRRGAG